MDRFIHFPGCAYLQTINAYGDVCFRCRMAGHYSRDCKEPRTNSDRRRRVKCNCRQLTQNLNLQILPSGASEPVWPCLSPADSEDESLGILIVRDEREEPDTNHSPASSSSSPRIVSTLRGLLGSPPGFPELTTRWPSCPLQTGALDCRWPGPPGFLEVSSVGKLRQPCLLPSISDAESRTLTLGQTAEEPWSLIPILVLEKKTEVLRERLVWDLEDDPRRMKLPPSRASKQLCSKKEGKKVDKQVDKVFLMPEWVSRLPIRDPRTTLTYTRVESRVSLMDPVRDPEAVRDPRDFVERPKPEVRLKPFIAFCNRVISKEGGTESRSPRVKEYVTEEGEAFGQREMAEEDITDPMNPRNQRNRDEEMGITPAVRRQIRRERRGDFSREAVEEVNEGAVGGVDDREWNGRDWRETSRFFYDFPPLPSRDENSNRLPVFAVEVESFGDEEFAAHLQRGSLRHLFQ